MQAWALGVATLSCVPDCVQVGLASQHQLTKCHLPGVASASSSSVCIRVAKKRALGWAPALAAAAGAGEPLTHRPAKLTDCPVRRLRAALQAAWELGSTSICTRLPSGVCTASSLQQGPKSAHHRADGWICKVRRRVAAAAPLPPGIPHPTLASAAVPRASPPLPQWLGLRQGRRGEFSSGPSFHRAEAPCSLISRTIKRGGGRKCACKQAASAAGRDMLARKQGEEPGQQVCFHMNTALQLRAATPSRRS